LLTECAGPCDIDRVSRGMNTLVPLLISLGRDFMKWIGIAVLILSSLFLTAQDVQKKEPPVLGPHRVRGAGHGKAGGGSPDLIYHGGPILPSITIRAIFWGTGWTSPADKITGLDKFYANIGTTTGGKGSAYQATVNEFTDNSGQMVTTATTYQGHLIDTSAVPRKISTSA